MNETVVRPIISDTALLCIALVIAMTFVGLLLYDLVRRRRRKRRHAHHHGPSHQPAQTWGTQRRKPFEGLRDIRRAFAQLARRRARRQHYEEQVRLAQEHRRQGLPPSAP